MATLIGYADGDARRFLNLLEQTKTSAETSGITRISGEFCRQRPDLELAPF
ncbi:hypothetical protein LP419_04130 [Massilia sp. H-1]|nr:hypothetical protein LP419_04130 [Massilia sp. H-1]